MVEDRGPLDLTLQIESKDKDIADLKHDNKSLAKQVDDKTEEIKALKMKLEMLDNKSSKWYNNTMKKIIIAFLVLCFTTTVGNTNEKTYTLTEFGNGLVEQKNKFVNHIANEKQDIIEYQKKSWAEGKDQFARTFTQIKSWFVKE